MVPLHDRHYRVVMQGEHGEGRAEAGLCILVAEVDAFPELVAQVVRPARF